MSEPIPESIPTSATHRPSHQPPRKRAKLTPTSAQSAHLTALFANPSKPISLPSSSSTTGTFGKPLPPPPEIVANVQGSSAGAGSGEFHVYKASRRREYERLRAMEEEGRREGEEREWVERRERQKKEDEERVERNRRKREKARMRKAKGKGGKGVPGMEGEEEMDVEGEEKVKVKKGGRLDVGRVPLRKEEEEEEEVLQGGEVKNSEEIGIVIHDDD